MIDALALLRPWWLAALPVVAVLAVVAVRRAAPLGDWGRAVDPALMTHLARSGAVLGGRRRASLAAALAAGLIALALTGPAVERRDAATFRNLDETVIVLDLSRSVAEGGNLGAVRQAAAAVAEAAGTRAVALVVYAGDAYLAVSPTTDRDSLGTTLFALDADTVPDRGSHPERGLALARRTLAEADVVAADVVLISDGDGIGDAAAREARALRDRGWRLQTLFVPAGQTVPPGAPRPDALALARLAAAGGGVAADVTAPAPVLDAVAEPTARHLAAGGYGVFAYADLGRWLLLLAALPALLLFRRSA
ncbi:VWA domain-containing protein [Methylobacterium sp. NEAU 140]|uniref:VWA domain-containing protein n=1 Tax=Methylobacterium sp. NEAU 140 TaxID=3064945 RepID=UPI00273526C8|nr:VWA domain-containing protein [Methylobacterium sp. NEAU 140]MDP4022691.1 VWA domain-containing protein [Methylobacterium sp. NEAU 140]